MNFANFLRTTFQQNTSGRLLLDQMYLLESEIKIVQFKAMPVIQTEACSESFQTRNIVEEQWYLLTNFTNPSILDLWENTPS